MRAYTDSIADKYRALTTGETGEWGSRDATSSGPPVAHIVSVLSEYTATNLVLMLGAIQAELELRMHGDRNA